MSPNFILIDGSYFCFYRYYAIHNWFKLARKEVTLDDPFKNDEFREKFRKTFVDKMKEIPKRLKIEKPIMSNYARLGVHFKAISHGFLFDSILGV